MSTTDHCRPFRLALAQMRVDGGDIVANMRRAIECIHDAADQDADIVLLPETLDIGWTHPSARELAAEIPGGGPCQSLVQAASDAGVWLCAGLTERDGDRVYNAAVLIDPQGTVRLLHRKLNELAIGHECYDQGDRLGVCHTPFGTLGLMICADGFANGQVLARSLGYMGAHVILSPSAWAVPADHDQQATPYGGVWRENYIPVARDFSLWIASCSNVGPITAGPWQSRKCIGCSMVVDPTGNITAQGGYGEEAEEIIITDVTPLPRPLRGDQWKSGKNAP